MVFLVLLRRGASKVFFQCFLSFFLKGVVISWCIVGALLVHSLLGSLSFVKEFG